MGQPFPLAMTCGGHRVGTTVRTSRCERLSHSARSLVSVGAHRQVPEQRRFRIPRIHCRLFSRTPSLRRVCATNRPTKQPTARARTRCGSTKRAEPERQLKLDRQIAAQNVAGVRCPTKKRQRNVRVTRLGRERRISWRHVRLSSWVFVFFFSL